MACEEGRVGCARTLLELGASIGQATSARWTPADAALAANQRSLASDLDRVAEVLGSRPHSHRTPLWFPLQVSFVALSLFSGRRNMGVPLAPLRTLIFPPSRAHARVCARAQLQDWASALGSRAANASSFNGKVAVLEELRYLIASGHAPAPVQVRACAHT